MMLEKLIVFVEEYSMEVALEILLPKMLGALDYQIITFSCKNELLKQLPERLKGYSTWLPKSWSLLVLVDREDDRYLSDADIYVGTCLWSELARHHHA